MEATYGHERMEAFREEGDDPMHMNHCFLLDAGRRPRMLLAMSSADGGSSRCVEMGLDASRWERCAAVTCISTIVHGSMELELRGLLDGSVQLARVGNDDECTVLLTYPIAKDDPITQAQMAVRDGTLLDIFVLLRSGKLIAVEDVDLNDLAVDPPPALPTLFEKVRLRMAAVGAQAHAERSSMMQLARNPNGSTTVFVANHGLAVVSRWTSGLAPAPGDPNKVSHSFIRDGSVTMASTTGPVLHLHLSDDAQFLVVVSSSCITWWDAATLTFLHELPVENIAAACALSPWSLAVACQTNTTTVTVQVVSLQYQGPWRSVGDVTSCTSIACPGQHNSVLVPCGPDLLLIGMTSENVIETYRVFQQQAPLAPLGVSPLQQLCDAMQDPNHAVSTESFQLAIWTHVQTSPDAVAAILELTFPRSEDMDTLFDALESWAYDEQDGLADAALLARIASVQYKWTTFQLLCAPDVAPIALDAWLSFRSAPLDDVLRLLLTQGALSRLQVLWRRHVSAELVRAFSLELLPSDVSANTVRSWILDDVLPAFEEYRVSLHDLTTAIVQRATALADDGDVDEARAWTELLRPQRIPKDRLWRYPPRHGDGHQSPHDDLRALDVQLQQLAYLDEVHGFHLSLRAFQMASMAGIAMSMLDRVLVPDLMASELACHVQPLLALCDTVSLDDVLTEYIAEKATSSQLLQTTEAHRCRVLIPRIESVEKRAAAALAFLQAVRAPYDAEIVALAHDAGTWPSLCRVELQAQLRVMELQDMCVAYGLRPFLATDALFASRFCRYICGQIDRPSALEDALQLARAFRHLHEHRIVVQFSQNVLASTWSDERQGRLLAALKALATPTRWSVAVEVVQFGLLRLETHERNGEKDALGHTLRYVLGFVSAVLTQYDAAKDGPHALLERTITLPLRRDLMKMAALFKEFGIALSLRTYQRDGSHTELLESQLQPWVKSLTLPAPSLKRKRVTQVVTVAKPPAASAEALAAVNTTQRLSSLLGQTPDQFRSFLALLAAKAGNTDQALRFARRSHPEQLKDVAVALLRHLVAANRTVQHAPNINLAVELLTLAVLQNPRVITAWPLLKLASLLQHIYSFTDDQTRQRDAIFEALQSWRVYDEWYRGSSVVLAPSVLPLAVQYVMALWTHDGDEDRLVMAATPLLSHLVDAQAHPLAIKALLHMPTVPQDARPVLGRQLDHMLSVIMHAPRIDRDLALGYLLSMEQQSAYTAFKKQIVRENVYKDFARLQQLARIGSDAARNWQQIAFLNQCNELESNAKWWHHLNLLGIACEHKAFQSERRNVQVLQAIVPQLLQATSLDLYCVLEFTRQYNIPDSYPCLLFVKALLLDTSSTDYTSRIVGVLEDIHQHELLQLLVSVLGTLPTRDYARLRFVLELLQQSNFGEQDEIANRLQVLSFLESFQPPLPFHELLHDPWAVLEPELSSASVVQLVSLSGPLDLDPDEMYMRLIKKLVLQHTTEQSLTLPFASFTEILQHLSSLQHKVTTTEWLSEKYKPPFQEHTVAALEFALSLTQATPYAQQGDEAKLAFVGSEATTRLQLKLLRIQTDQCWLAAANHFAEDAAPTPCPPYTSPADVIGHLYETFGHLAHKQMSPLVNAMAAQVARLHRQSISSIRKDWMLRRLQQCAPPSNDAPGLWAAFGAGDDPDETTLVDRLVYACADEPLATTGAALWAYASNPAPRSGVTYRAKHRALQLLVQLFRTLDASVESVLSGVTHAQLLAMRQHCCHLARFEALQFPQAFGHFVQCDKAALVRGLWREHHTKRDVVDLLATLMLAYTIHDATLWQRILSQMTALEMFPSLFQLLRPLSRLPVLQASSMDMVALYNRVLLWPLQQLAAASHLDDADVPRVQHVLSSIVLSLQQCPFLERLDLRGLVDALDGLTYMQLPLPLRDVAVECALTVPQQSARLAMLEVLVARDASYLVALLRVLFRLPLDRLEAGHRRCLSWVADRVVERQSTRDVLGQAEIASSYCEFVASSLSPSPALDHVVAQLLEENRMGDANHVVELHLQARASPIETGLALEVYLAETTSPLLLGFRSDLLQ